MWQTINQYVCPRGRATEGGTVSEMVKRYRNLFKNTVILAAGTFASKVLVFLLLPLYTAYLLPEMFSAAELISQMSNLLMPLACLGLTDGIFRFAMDLETDRWRTFSTGIVLLGASSLIFLALSPLLSLFKYFDGYLWLIILYVLTANLHALCAQYLRAQGKTAIFAVQGLINTALNIALNLLFLIPLSMGVLGYVLSVVVANVLTTLFLVFYAKLWRDVSFRAFDAPLSRKLLRYSVPMIPTTIFWWMTSVSDRYLVQHFCGGFENGLYSASYKIPTLLTLLCTIFIEAWQFSAVCDSEDGQERTGFFSEIYAGFSGLMFLACSFLIALSQVAVNILFADTYRDAWQYIPVLLIATVFSALVTYLGSVYFVEKKSMLSFLTAMLGAGVNILLNFLWIPGYGAQGAALATLVSYVVVYVVRSVDTKRHIPFAQNRVRIGISTLLVGAQAAAMVFRPSYWVAYQAAGMVLVLLLNLRPILRVVMAFCGGIFRRFSTKRGGDE